VIIKVNIHCNFYYSGLGKYLMVVFNQLHSGLWFSNYKCHNCGRWNIHSPFIMWGWWIMWDWWIMQPSATCHTNHWLRTTSIIYNSHFISNQQVILGSPLGFQCVCSIYGAHHLYKFWGVTKRRNGKRQVCLWYKIVSPQVRASVKVKAGHKAKSMVGLSVT